MLRVIRATRKSMLQFQGPIFWKLNISAKFNNQSLKKENATLINALIGSILWNKNMEYGTCVHFTWFINILSNVSVGEGGGWGGGLNVLVL